jgi:hypothetical protein
VPGRISHRLDEHVVACCSWTKMVDFRNGPMRALDGLQYIAIITVVGGQMDDLRESLQACLLKFTHVKCKHEIKTLDSTATIKLVDEKLLKYLHFCR